MDINVVLNGLDQLFEECRIDEVEDYLTDRLDQARAEGDMHSYITLLNEMIGYCRDTSQYEKAARYCKLAEDAISQEKLEGSVAHATTLLNIANAYRAAARLDESMEYYRRVFPIYEKNLEKTDFRYASLHNNLSLLYQEMGDYEKACEYLERALSIVLLYPEARIELAVTHTNLGMSLLKLGRDDEAAEHLGKAFELFEQDEERDYHYSAALSAMAEAQYHKGNLQEAIEYDRQALSEIEKHVGRTQAYEVVKQNLERIEEELAIRERRQKEAVERGRQNISGLALCRQYFETYQHQLLKGFEEYEPQMAFGLVGDGSECLGFDDASSHDHDFGPGFCVFLKRELYDKIGQQLAEAYAKLPAEFLGYKRNVTRQGEKRIGVICIEDFYAGYIGCEDVPQTDTEWLYATPDRFRAATSGEVFVDHLGEFTRIRNGLLQYYPEPMRRKMLAGELAMMAQTGQYNYERMLRRGEKVTTQLILAKYMEHTMNAVYLLNRVYAPFYKWTHRGMQNLEILPEIMDILNAIGDMEYGDNRILKVIEIIARLILHELHQQGLSESEELYLEEQAYIVAQAPVIAATDGSGKQEENRETTEAGRTEAAEKSGNVSDRSKEEPSEKLTPGTNTQEGREQRMIENDQDKQHLVDLAVQLEWEAFDKVDNRGGRADCQDDYPTFSIMRKSQYLTWTAEMLDQYIQDFMAASDAGINLITQKYGYMMESTAPEEFAQIKDKLMPVPDDKRTLIEQIVQIQVGFMEEFAKTHPLSASNARSIHTSEDNLHNTSYETYLRGELMTYSDDMLLLYGRFIAGKAKNGENLAREILDHTAVLYGYESVDDLEEKLAKYRS